MGKLWPITAVGLCRRDASRTASAPNPYGRTLPAMITSRECRTAYADLSRYESNSCGLTVGRYRSRCDTVV